MLGFIEVAGGLKRLYGDDEAEQSEACDDGDEAAEPGPGGTAVNAPRTGARPDRPSRSAQLGLRPDTPHGKARGRLIRPDAEPRFVSDDFDALSSGGDDEIILEVVVTEEMLHELLNSPLGSCARLIVEHVPSDSDWQRIEASSATVIN